MGDLAIVALVGVIGLFLVFFFLLTVGLAVGIAVGVAVVGREKRKRRWGMRAPWLPLTYPVFVPLAVLKEQYDKVCQTEKQ
jgi:ABC-type Fe3+ transport system permease subunit